MSELLMRRIGCLATHTGVTPARGAQMSEIQLMVGVALHISADGMIEGIYDDGALPEGVLERCEVYDAQGLLVTPGLIDCHTHAVFGGWRDDEVARRIQGESQQSILESGGGVLSTVRATRLTSEQELYEKTYGFLQEMLMRGVTACEIKSGYGLDAETELKQLRVARALGAQSGLDIKTTFLGAQAVPQEFAGRGGDYVEFLIKRAIPTIAGGGLADFCDVVVDAFAFDLRQSRRILLQGIECGMKAKMHADELEPLGAAALAAEVGAISADSLIASDVDMLQKMAQGPSVAVLLPQTSFYLDKPYARARRMIDLNIPVALATDFNPGSCPSNNLNLSMNLAFIKYRMMPEEILTAVTLNAACAIDLQHKLGTIEPGKQADLVVWNASELSMLCYRLGSPLVRDVFKKGIRIERRRR